MWLTQTDDQPNVREGDPRYSRITHKAWTLGCEFRDFNDNLGFRQKFRYADRETDQAPHLVVALRADGRTFTRTAVYHFGDLKRASAVAKLLRGCPDRRRSAQADYRRGLDRCTRQEQYRRKRP